jgi:hypothetical protein
MGVNSSTPTPPSAGPQARATLTSADAANLPIVPHYVYALLSEHVYNEMDRRPLPPGWKQFMSCDEVQLDKEGYYATAYVNEALEHCIIAERGTSDALGIRAGVWMYFDEPTIQFSLAEQFSKLVRLRLALTRGSPSASDDSPYVISYTGHSLGAVLAACRACAEHTFAITFESPGCKAFVEKTMYPFRADDVDIITYLRSPNPINTLRPQCGYLVQLPTTHTVDVLAPVAPVAPPASSGIKSLKISLPSIPSPQEYLKNKILDGIPELQQYLTKIEPLLREMLNHTQQTHSISTIVSFFEKHDEPAGQDVILVWPTHLMQFLEYYNITKAMEDPQNQSTHVYSAYQTLLQRLYVTALRPKHRIPFRCLNKDVQKLLRLWWALTPQQTAELPLSDVDRRALNSTAIVGENMQSEVITAFQMKQYLTLVVARNGKLRNMLDTATWNTTSLGGAAGASKL